MKVQSTNDENNSIDVVLHNYIVHQSTMAQITLDIFLNVSIQSNENVVVQLQSIDACVDSLVRKKCGPMIFLSSEQMTRRGPKAENLKISCNIGSGHLLIQVNYLF